MYLSEYETTVVIRPDVGGDAVETMLTRLREVVKNQGGKFLAINHWGKKKLAYEIEKQSRGIYVNAHYLGPNVLVAELERNLRISDNVLRFLTVRLADKVRPDEREEREYVRPQYDVDDSAVDEPVFGDHGSESRGRAHGDDADEELGDDADFDADDKDIK